MVKQAFHAFGMVWNTKEAAVIYRSKFWSACDELKLWGELPMYMGGPYNAQSQVNRSDGTNSKVKLKFWLISHSKIMKNHDFLPFLHF